MTGCLSDWHKAGLPKFWVFHIAFLEDETSPKNKVPVFAVQQKRIIYSAAG
jgi:hypothetical protein